MAAKDAPAHQIHLPEPQSEKGKRPQLLRRRQKTLPPTKSISLGPKARRASDHNCSDSVKRHSRPPNRGRWAPKQEGQATATAQTASKDTPAHQIHLAGPQSEKGKRPQLLRRSRKNSKTSSRRVKQGRLAATNLHHATRPTTPRHHGCGVTMGWGGPPPTPRKITNGVPGRDS